MSRITIKVKYFASLRERLGRAEDRLEVEEQASVGALWERVRGGVASDVGAPGAAGPPPGAILATVNLEYARAERLLRAGDEVAFFPPVTGG